MALPDFEAWAIFAKVAERGSFAGAAADLGLAKATVSKAVARLEQRIAAPLFNRSTRRLSLTDAGTRAVASAERILAAGEKAEADAMDQAAVARGTVRLAAPMSFGLAHLAPLMPEFLAAYPEVAVDLHLSDEQVDLIGGGFDLALRIAALPDSSLKARRLCRVRRLLVGAPTYFDRMGRPAHPRELEHHACLGYAYLPTRDRWRFIHASGEEVSIGPMGPMRANNADALAPALLAGSGLAVQPEFLVWRDVAEGRLEAVLQEWSLPAIALNLVAPPTTVRPPRIAVLIDFLVARLANAPWTDPAHRQTST